MSDHIRSGYWPRFPFRFDEVPSGDPRTWKYKGVSPKPHKPTDAEKRILERFLRTFCPKTSIDTNNPDWADLHATLLWFGQQPSDLQNLPAPSIIAVLGKIWIDAMTESDGGPSSADGTQGVATPDAAAVADRQPAVDSNERPKNYLFGWADIINAVGMKYSEGSRKALSRLNEFRSGPIRKPKNGGRPQVERSALIEWWNRLDMECEAGSNQRDGKRLDAETQYAYGKESNVVPGVGGALRKRRKDKQP